MSQNTDNLLLSVINSKEAIKTAIEAKGVDMTAIPFNEYAGKIIMIPGKYPLPVVDISLSFLVSVSSYTIPV